MKSKLLIISSVNYPFSNGEHLLSAEIESHRFNFDQIIVISTDVTNNQSYYVGKKIKVLRFDPKIKKLDFFRYFFKILFSLVSYNEIKLIIFKYRLVEYKTICRRAISSIIYALKYKKYLFEIIEKYKSYDIYLYSWWVTNVTLAFCLIKEKNPNIKITSRARAIDLYLYRHKPMYLPFRNYIFKKLDMVFPISQEGANYIMNTFPTTSFNKIMISRMGVKSSRNISDYRFTEPMVIVSCSDVIALKRIDYIIEVLELIENIDIKWIHFGTGILMKEISNLAETKLGRLAHINYMIMGYVDNNKLMDFYSENRVDLFINLSKYEGVPVSIMEAFSFGIPAIATNVGGVSELVNNQNGFLVENERNPQAIAKIINDFRTNIDANGKKYRTNAYRTWNELYNCDKNFINISKIISEITT